MTIEYLIRQITESEYEILQDFLYEAIFIPEGMSPPGRNIIQAPELQIYVKDFGKKPGDHCLLAEVHGSIAGAVWARIMNDYGHIDDETPSLAISLYPQYRGQGIGTGLMKAMLSLLRERGYRRASLSVQKANYAVRMYAALGFEIFRECGTEFIMVIDLQQTDLQTSMIRTS